MMMFKEICKVNQPQYLFIPCWQSPTRDVFYLGYYKIENFYWHSSNMISFFFFINFIAWSSQGCLWCFSKTDSILFFFFFLPLSPLSSAFRVGNNQREIMLWRNSSLTKLWSVMVGGRAECLVRFKISRNITYFLLKELWSEQDGKGSRNEILI